MQELKNKTSSKNIVILIFVISLIVFVYFNDGHRYTFDEDVAQKQSYRIATLKDDPSYIPGKSGIFFEYPWLYPESLAREKCYNGILCSSAYIFHSITQVPFLLFNITFDVFPNISWTGADFDDINYVNWRNSLDPNFTFMEIFFGPTFTALSVSIFFLICRLYDISLRNSIFSAMFFAFSTLIFPYSQTSLNVVPMISFVLLGYYFFKKYAIVGTARMLVFSGISLGLAYLTRPDSVLFIIPMFFVLFFIIVFKHYKIFSIFAFIIPIISSYVIHQIIDYVRVGSQENAVVSISSNLAHGAYLDHSLFHENLFALFFSPGVGLFVFCPILILTLVGFFDFFKKSKPDALLLISFSVIFSVFYASGDNWHGFVGWGPRYLLPIVPFLLLPIMISFDKRTIYFKLLVGFFASLGVFFNLLYLLQDVSWFVWGFFGDDSRGLYSLGRRDDGSVFPLWINPLVIWSFEYSQLTQSFYWLINNPQIDFLLLKILGLPSYLISFSLLLGSSIFALRFYFTKNNS